MRHLAPPSVPCTLQNRVLDCLCLAALRGLFAPPTCGRSRGCPSRKSEPGQRLERGAGFRSSTPASDYETAPPKNTKTTPNLPKPTRNSLQNHPKTTPHPPRPRGEFLISGGFPNPRLRLHVSLDATRCQIRALVSADHHGGCWHAILCLCSCAIKVPA